MVLSQYSIGSGMLFFLEAPFGKDSDSIFTRCGAQNEKNKRNNKSQQNSESVPILPPVKGSLSDEVRQGH